MCGSWVGVHGSCTSMHMTRMQLWHPEDLHALCIDLDQRSLQHASWQDPTTRPSQSWEMHVQELACDVLLLNVQAVTLQAGQGPAAHIAILRAMTNGEAGAEAACSSL